MDYRVLNLDNKNYMKGSLNTKIVMPWENKELMAILTGKLPSLRRYFGNQEKIYSYINKLDNLLVTYNYFEIDKVSFIGEVMELINTILEVEPLWNGITIDEVQNAINVHNSCLVYGDGGIGKSFFIYRLEEQLEFLKIPHLCLYGKFEKDTDNIDINQIIEASNNGFIFIFDAVNEMSEDGQRHLLLLLDKLKQHNKIRIIITYRTDSLDEHIETALNGNVEIKYSFEGVSFEYTLQEIAKLSVSDAYKYEDILYSNNALQLSILLDLLKSNKIEYKKLNSICSITCFYENYIEKSIKHNLEEKCGNLNRQIWLDTKNIATYMYTNEKKYIDVESLLNIVKTGNQYIDIMSQLGYISWFNYKGKLFYQFSVDALSDYLIARSMFKVVAGKSDNQIIDILKTKRVKFPTMIEAFILVLFDKMAPDYKRIQGILKESKLWHYFKYETLLKINFTIEGIEKFQRTFKVGYKEEMFLAIGGYSNKPFNCSNYFYEYYKENIEGLVDLSKALEKGTIIKRLKNILYFIELNGGSDVQVKEAFCFALLCTAAPNEDIRALALKILHEIAYEYENYRIKLIEDYDKFPDYYIKENIIYVLSKLKKDDCRIVDFFCMLIKQDMRLSDKSIRRISEYIKDDYGYINWNRENLYELKENSYFSENFYQLLFDIYCHDKEFLPFKYGYNHNIEVRCRFIALDKKVVKELNKKLQKKYPCVKNGDCNGTTTLECLILPQLKKKYNICNLDENSFVLCFEKVLKSVLKDYDFEIDSINKIRMGNFENSTFRKCLDIAKGIYYGSLMCNYYSDRFASFGNFQDCIGYEVYDPLEYGEEINITSPLSIYNENIDLLGNLILSSVELPPEKNAKWHTDIALARKNILNILKPVQYRSVEWVMLAGRLSLYKNGNDGYIWKDTYEAWCCTSTQKTIREDGNARYLTIEHSSYNGLLEEYQDNKVDSFLCKKIDPIMSRYEQFDDTSLIFPPAELIKFLDLKLDKRNMTWKDCNDVDVIICNNNRSNYFKDNIISTVFIRKDYLGKYLESKKLKYFAFSERYLEEKGYAPECDLHFEICNGEIIKEILNSTYIPQYNMRPIRCIKCKKVKRRNRSKNIFKRVYWTGENDLE